MKKRLLALLLMLVMALMPLTACAAALEEEEYYDEVIVEDGVALSEEYMVEYGYDYSTPEEVAMYLYAFRELPPNFMTKYEAQSYGWVSNLGNLWDVAYGFSIGGDKFGNREGLLPDKKGRQWYECDVNYEGGFRDAERIVFSSDGLICYSNDHYKSYDVLYEGWYDYGDGIEHVYGDYLEQIGQTEGY